MVGKLSLDIAMCNLGWVYFEEDMPISCGVIRPKFFCKEKLSVREKNVRLIEGLSRGFFDLAREYTPTIVVGEAPTGGAQSASAAVMMNMALATVCAVCVALDLPYRWCSPVDVKKATVGPISASKEQIMDWAVARYGGKKQITPGKAIKRGQFAGQVNHKVSYYFLGGWHSPAIFEHIADACGAAVADADKRG